MVVRYNHRRTLDTDLCAPGSSLCEVAILEVGGCGVKKPIVQMGRIEQRILLIRGEKVIVDADLAEFYGVTTKRLNEQVKRNRERFTGDGTEEFSKS